MANRSDLPNRLVSAFFRFKRTPWHYAPADGLSQAETDVLETIKRAVRHGHTPRVSDISSALHVSSPTVTQHIHSLEGKGLVIRTHSKDDKRSVNLSLSDRGEQALNSHRINLERDFEEFIRSVGEEDSEILAALLLKAHVFFTAKANFRKSDDMFNEV